MKEISTPYRTRSIYRSEYITYLNYGLQVRKHGQSFTKVASQKYQTESNFQRRIAELGDKTVQN